MVKYEYVRGTDGNLVKVAIDDSATKKTVKYEYVRGTDGNLVKVAIDDSVETNQKRTWFKKGAFEDGYQFGDVTTSVASTVGDAALGIVQGAGNMVEGVVDLGMYGVAGISDLVGADSFADDVKSIAQKEAVNDAFGKVRDAAFQKSFLGEKSVGVANGVGQAGLKVLTAGLGQAAGLGEMGVSALTTGTMFASSAGSGMSEAYQGGATDGEAVAYGILKGAVDAGSELLFGGLGKTVNALGIGRGISSLDDIFAKRLSNGIKNQVAKTMIEYGVKASAEGLEEVIAGVGAAAAKKLTYLSDEDLTKLVKDEDLLEQFIAGAVTSGIMQGGDVIRSAKNGTDLITSLTKNEELVVEKEVANRIAEAQEDGVKINKSKIYEQVKSDLVKGYIGIDTIESALGGETYKSYQALSERERTMQKEYDTLNKMKQGDMTGEQSDRRAELKEQLTELKNSTKKTELKEKLGKEVSELAKADRLGESYNEKTRKTQAYSANLERYSKKQQETITRAMQSGILNNTNRTHDFVDMLAKLSEDKGVSFDFTNNQRLKESGFALEGKTVNGFVKDGNISLNIDSTKYLNAVVGHEITHVLDGTELYGELQQAVKEFAKSKGEYKKRLEELQRLYEGIEGTNIENELTADLIGDYLFTDSDFVSSLSTKKPGLFQKIFEEIKYLIKTATAGSKQEREMEKVKRAFEKAYRDATVNKDSELKYSLKKDENGNLFVDVEEDIFAGKSGESVAKIIQKVISEKFDNLIRVNGQQIQINKTTNDEFRRSNSANALMDNPSQAYNDKLRTLANADEILSAAKSWIGEKRKHLRKDDIIEFARGNVSYRVGKNGYVADVIVGIRKNGAAVLYDLVNIYDKKIAETPVTMTSNKSSQRRQDASTKDTIPQENENVKYSLGEDIAPIGNYDVRGKDIALGPVREDVAPVQQKAPISQQAIKRSYEQSEDKSFYQFVEDALTGKLQGKSFHKLNQKISARMANDIESLVGFSVEGYSNDISQNHIKHIEARHGANGVADHSMENLHDIARMGYVIDYYDKMEKGKLNYEYKNSDGSPSQTVVLQKKIDDNYYYVVEAVPDAKLKTLHVVSAYINKNDTLSGVGVANALNPDARNEPQSNVSSSDTSIPQNEGNASEYKENVPVQQAYSPDELPTWDDVVKRQPETGTYAPVQENFPVKKATTVKERNAKKLQSLKIQLKNEQAHMKQEHAAFNVQLRDLQSEYDSKKNKNTKLAQALLARMERKKKLRDSIDADYEKRISDLKKKIDKMSSEKFKTAEQRQAKEEELQSWARELMGDTSTWKDKKWGLLYKINTLHRNLRDIVRGKDGKSDIDRADAIYDALQGTYNHNQAEKNRESNAIKSYYAEKKITSAENAYIQMLGEYQYNPDTTLTAKVLEEYYEEHSKKINLEKVNEVIASARKLYDELFERINAVLEEHGMKPLKYREGYFPHFTEDKQNFVAKLFDWKTKNDLIPTDIAGLTEKFKPNKSYQPFDKHRTGDKTEYNFLKGLDMYVDGALDWIYHIEDIQKRRAFENEIRYRHSEKGIQEKIEAIQNNTELDEDEAQAQMELVYADAKNPLNNFITDFRTQTNLLAGKKHSMDREMEEWTNRKSYSIMTNVSRRLNANMVVGSFSSALTNFIPITQSWGEVNPIWTLKAGKELTSDLISTHRLNGEVVEKSAFLTNRLNQSQNLYKTGWDVVGGFLGKPMEVIDNITSQIVWRSKYLQNLSRGMSENAAIKNADQFAENVMAGRSKGNMPTLFEAKNPIVKMFTAFQLEVNNQYGYLFKDLPQEARNTSLAKLTNGYASIFIGAWVYNALYSTLTGRDAALDPIGMVIDVLKDIGIFGEDEKEEPEDVVLNLTESVLDEVPFVGGLLGGGRIQLSSALPYGGSGSFKEGMENFLEDLKDRDGKSILKELSNTFLYAALPMGGSQLKKTVQGLKMYDSDLPVYGSYTDSGNLRFTAKDTILSRVQAGVFGQWASKNAREYVERNRSPLGKNQMNELLASGLPMADYWKYQDGLKKKKTVGEKIDYIANMDLPVETKNILANHVADRNPTIVEHPANNIVSIQRMSNNKTPLDLSEYNKFADYEDFDNYVKDKEMYTFLKENGIAYSDYKAMKDSTKAMYRQLQKDKKKYQLSQVITEDITQYIKFKGEISDIKADTNAMGKIIKTRKQKVIQYINGLELAYGQKLLLFKSIYQEDNTYNQRIVDYLNDREDISYFAMKELLETLGFTVLSDGRVRW